MLLFLPPGLHFASLLICTSCNEDFLYVTTVSVVKYITRNKFHMDVFWFSWKLSLKPLIFEERLWWYYYVNLLMKHVASESKWKYCTTFILSERTFSFTCIHISYKKILRTTWTFKIIQNDSLFILTLKFKLHFK